MYLLTVNHGRVRSFATGKGGARKADADLLRPKKSKKGNNMPYQKGKKEIITESMKKGYKKVRSNAI